MTAAIGQPQGVLLASEPLEGKALLSAWYGRIVSDKPFLAAATLANIAAIYATSGLSIPLGLCFFSTLPLFACSERLKILADTPPWVQWAALLCQAVVAPLLALPLIFLGLSVVDLLLMMASSIVLGYLAFMIIDLEHTDDAKFLDLMDFTSADRWFLGGQGRALEEAKWLIRTLHPEPDEGIEARGVDATLAAQALAAEQKVKNFFQEVGERATGALQKAEEAERLKARYPRTALALGADPIKTRDSFINRCRNVQQESLRYWRLGILVALREGDWEKACRKMDEVLAEGARLNASRLDDPPGSQQLSPTWPSRYKGLRMICFNAFLAWGRPPILKTSTDLASQAHPLLKFLSESGSSPLEGEQLKLSQELEPKLKALFEEARAAAAGEMRRAQQIIERFPTQECPPVWLGRRDGFIKVCREAQMESLHYLQIYVANAARLRDDAEATVKEDEWLLMSRRLLEDMVADPEGARPSESYLSLLQKVVEQYEGSYQKRRQTFLSPIRPKGEFKYLRERPFDAAKILCVSFLPTSSRRDPYAEFIGITEGLGVRLGLQNVSREDPKAQEAFRRAAVLGRLILARQGEASESSVTEAVRRAELRIQHYTLSQLEGELRSVNASLREQLCADQVELG